MTEPKKPAGTGRIIPVFLIILAILLGGCIRHEGNALPAKARETNLIVIRVIDGDTLVLSNQETVRLIGIDTPERKEKCYKEAGKKLSELALWKDVELEKDVEEYDSYGRSLYYLYIDGNFINLEMVRLGYASKFEYPPNVRYAEQIAEAEDEAINSNAGCLWA